MSASLSGRINVRSIFATTMAIFAIFMLSAGIAHAQFLFWPRDTFWPDHYAPFKHKHHHRQTNSESAKDARPEAPPKGPLQIIISIADQRVSLFDNGTLIARSPVSTGTQEHPTPLGVFSVIGKQRWHRSNIYSAAPMPYMQRITWSGIALHAGVVPGHPASHGCIRLKNDFAIRLWHLTKRGTRVIIAHDDVQPVEITNPHLFKPKAVSGSPEFQAATVAESISTVAVTHGSPVSNAETPEATSLQVPGSAPAGGAPKKIVPISVFVSRKLSKLFVRQGFSPLFDVPIKIENPEEPLGTHVFTAMEFQNGGAAIRWTVVSIPEELPRISEGATKEREAPAKQTAPLVSLPEKANAALDRIEIPQDTVERISELLTPASSLIISDNGFSHETGKDTDFIVVTH
ncbi:L,D-transpeptidase [Bradyrhizobium canariense]|uniref:L,D-transpeptidase catalytic domain n=1 Tax=Bradyrhizobium canariense TaxID=255045 RepID=A0A1H1QP43_9BRAD|nr:L,D-transpeptidase [Bradyrhizobium canariense]SDS25251.1 L,D-transpeptidase catalytic domain [Bradyrhizobium canariense]